MWSPSAPPRTYAAPRCRSRAIPATTTPAEDAGHEARREQRSLSSGWSPCCRDVTGPRATAHDARATLPESTAARATRVPQHEEHEDAPPRFLAHPSRDRLRRLAPAEQPRHPD